ncbi:MAG: hypothetical protein JWO80_4921 [Bryobacterales bacterium]|nr:hypothetical protein [Bryobacterales bacterium]
MVPRHQIHFNGEFCHKLAIRILKSAGIAHLAANRAADVDELQPEGISLPRLRAAMFGGPERVRVRVRGATIVFRLPQIPRKVDDEYFVLTVMDSGLGTG